ncbi:hypothetical protein [Streptomyces sp. CS62]|uniref:hypothetical protein n=1 Tax=Streptomyces sp. CS62 TaxID=3119268 RepID=UPI002F955254
MTLAEQAAVAEGGLALVSGIYGHGKSRFLDEAARLVPAARRLNLPRTPSVGDAPLGLLNAILGGIGRGAGDGRVDASALQTPLTDDRLAEQVVAHLVDSAADAPLVLLVDDVLCIDERSTKVLTLVAQRLHATRVLLVLAVEDRPWDPEAYRRTLDLGQTSPRRPCTSAGSPDPGSPSSRRLGWRLPTCRSSPGVSTRRQPASPSSSSR